MKRTIAIIALASASLFLGACATHKHDCCGGGKGCCGGAACCGSCKG